MVEVCRDPTAPQRPDPCRPPVVPTDRGESKSATGQVPHRALGTVDAVRHKGSVDPCRHRVREGDPVDLTTFLILAVAVLIVLSGYFLFNDVPTMRDSGTRRRR